jgi:eukaryotic-like serine/threonine-protein kinase
MATVFLAQDAKHGSPVALKVLHQDLAASLGPERFRREIALAARLQHPHILSVLDSGESANGLLWFTMPYVEGESLRDRLRREGQLPLEDALRITREVALALEYAHRHGVIHRDVKPENILLTSDGQALVADFGIARALAPGASNTTLTETGAAIGTPQYMSPEQASAERTLTSRTDVYSLGAVLYEMLAGEPPFTGPTAQAIVAKMMTGEPPSVRRARASVPAAVDAAIQRALAPVPADRFATALEFSKALDAAERTGFTAAPSIAPLSPASAPAPTSAPVPSSASRRRFPVAAAALGLGIVIGGGLLFAWRRHAGGTLGPAEAGTATLAVLPFENEGDSADAYFADGMTDEVRTKLSGLSALAVIATTSSNQYRRTTKSLDAIGRELGVRYLLLGRVRWEKHGAQSRVRVDPELIEVTSGAAPKTAWHQDFDADLTDVFQVQADIATKVADQLRLRLGTQDREALAARPTDNLDAYDAYLRGQAIDREGDNPAVKHRALAAYHEAVQRDSSFALAWAAMAEAYALNYANGIPSPAVADSARTAGERALALAPDLAEGHVAMAAYYSEVTNDFQRARIEDSIGLARAPNSAPLLGRSGYDDEHVGQWDAARARFELAARLDPQSTVVIDRVALLDIALRRYAAALAATDHGLALEPDNLALREDRVMVAVAQGDLPGARAILHAAPAPLDTAALAAYVATYWDLGWVLDSAEERVLLRLTPSAYDDSRGQWGINLAEQYGFRGDRARARAYADSARAGFEAELRVAPGDAQRHLDLGLALAYMGRKGEAIAEGLHGLSAAPISMDGYNGPYYQHVMVRIYLLVGENEKALELLEPLLRIPYFLSPAWLRIDPNFAPLHGNPRFERLIAGT